MFFDTNTSKKPGKISVIGIIMISIFAVLLLRAFLYAIDRRKEVKRKLKYFNPVITETWWGKKITWVGRDRPLTDEQLQELL